MLTGFSLVVRKGNALRMDFSAFYVDLPTTAIGRYIISPK